MRLKVLLAAIIVFGLSFYDIAAQTAGNYGSHSPKKATILSAVLPGAGQVYNKQAWKVPVIYAIGAGVTYFAVTNYNNSVKFKNEYYNRINGNTGALLEDYTKYSDESILALHQAYDKNFQLSVVIGAVVYLLNIVDAMVYAHLFEFNMNEDLSFKFMPSYVPPTSWQHESIGLSLRINIK